jgi:hypothetical protein
LSHAGVKYEISENFWILALFTSKATTHFYENILVNNLYVPNNIHLYVNNSFLILNSTFSEYCTISNNIAHAPLYIQNQYLNNQLNTKFLIQDSIRAYRISVMNANFNNPAILIDTLYDYYFNLHSNSKSVIKPINTNCLTLCNKIDFLKDNGFRNEDIWNFAENFNNNKNIKGESYFKDNLFYEDSDLKFK